MNDTDTGWRKSSYSGPQNACVEVWRKSSYSGAENNCVEVWRKSSYSGPENNCIEVVNTLDLVRDSKNPEGPALRVRLAPLLAWLLTDR